jgi:hypothetical protein
VRPHGESGHPRQQPDKPGGGWTPPAELPPPDSPGHPVARRRPERADRPESPDLEREQGQDRPPDAARRLGWLLGAPRYLLGLVAAAVVGVVVPAAIDWVSAHVGEPAAVVVLNEFGSGGGSMVSAYAVGRVLDPAAVQGLDPNEGPDDGVPIGPYEIRIAVTNRRADQVVVVGLRARVTERSAPIGETALIERPQGGGEIVPDIPLLLDLDSTPAEAQVASASNPNAVAPPADPARAFFGEQSTPIADGDTVIFSITARTASCTCAWVIELDLLVDGRLEQRVVGGEGGRFQTTAPQRGYRAGYEAKPGQSQRWEQLPPPEPCLAQCKPAGAP